MDEQCIDCGHEFDIHHLTSGMCSMCLEIENQDNEDFHESYRIIGLLTKVMKDICIYKYGNDDSLLGVLTLRQDTNNPIRVNNFGQVHPNTRLMQGTVEGSYQMFLMK